METSNEFLQSSICKVLYPFARESAREGRYKDADELLRFILNHDSSPEYLLLLGKVYAQQGRYEDAINEWRKALEIDPDDQEVKAAKQKAEKLSKPFYLPSEVFKKKLSYGIICVFIVISLGVSFSLWKSKKHSEVLAVKYWEIEKELTALKKKADLESIDDMIKRVLVGKGFADFNLVVKQNSRHILITGNVPSQYLKDMIGKTVKHIEYVNSVDITDIEVSHKYSVSQGDNLGKIAQRVYGNHERWNEIFDANRGKLNTPDKLAPCISLYIP